MLIVKVMNSVPRNKTNQNLKAEKEPECSKRKFTTIQLRFHRRSIQDVKLLESSTSSYLVVESSSGYHHVSHSVYEQLLRTNKLAE